MLDLLKQRRSIRKYKDKPIEKNKLERLLKSVLLAPSSMNRKPLEFIVIEEKETINKLSSCKTMGTLGLNTAPMAIAIIANTEVSDVWIEDASIAATILSLQAEALGLGSCWIQVRNRESENGSSENKVKSILNIPDKFGVLALFSIGYKGESKNSYNESDLDCSKIHFNKF